MPANPRCDARRKAGFRTQADLAEYLGVCQSTVAHWERLNTNRPPPKWYYEIIRLLIMEREINERTPS